MSSKHRITTALAQREVSINQCGLATPHPHSRLKTMTVLSIILAVLGLAITAISALCLSGSLPGNRLIGLHIPEVRKSAAYWTLGHRIAGPAWLGAGCAILAAAVLAFNAAGWVWLIIMGLLIASVILLGLGAALASHTLAQLDARAQEASAEGSDCCSAESGATSAGANSGSATASHCCSSGSTDGIVSAEACASGQACGSCSLNGSCEGGAAAFNSNHSTDAPAQQHLPPAVNVDAARRAAAAQDSTA